MCVWLNGDDKLPLRLPGAGEINFSCSTILYMRLSLTRQGEGFIRDEMAPAPSQQARTL